MNKLLINEGPRVYLLDKPEELTSFDVIRRIKKKVINHKKEKIGHFGTLDPFATGLLLIGAGGATRLMNLVHDTCPKTYRAKGLFGESFDTGDKTGQLEKKEKLPEAFLENEQYLKEVLSSFKGPYSQFPPAFSATKHEGRPLYEWAREGIKIEKPAVERFIHSISLIEVEGSSIDFEVTVSTGTYIRVLFEDIAKKLGTIGHLTDLRRTKIGDLSVSDAIELGTAQKAEVIHSVELNALLPFPIIELSKEESDYLGNGRTLNRDVDGAFGDLYWARAPYGIFQGLLKKKDAGLVPEIVFPNSPKYLA